MISIILLAAGMSRRLQGINKLLLPLGDKTVLQCTLEQLIAAHIGQLLVITGYEHEKIAALLSPYPNIVVLHNPHYATGMTRSIKIGVEYAAHASGYMIALGDMPLISSEVYRKIAQVFESKYKKTPLIVRPMALGKLGNPVLFSADFRADLLSHTALDGCKELLKPHCIEYVVTEDIFQDIDNWQDYEKLRAQW